MCPELNRRDFLKGLPFAGAVLPAAAQAAARTLAGESAAPQLEGEFLSVAFDTGSGRLEVWRRGGDRLLSGSISRANTSRGRRTTAEAAYRRTVDTAPVRDRLGEGRQLVARCADGERRLDFEVRAALYEGRQSVLVEVLCRNVSSQPIVVESVEPLCATAETGGALHWPGVTKILTNGPMYYDPGKVADFASPGPSLLRSWWNIGLFRGYQSEGIACGYVENQTALGQVVARRDGRDAIGLVAESVLAKGFELQPGRAISSGRFFLNIGPDPYSALETYAEAMGRILGARVHSVLNGWCDWFFAFEHITEEEVIRNAEAAARTLKPFGLEYIQVDEGFQRWHGEWEGNAKFPHGMKWLADRIRSLGLKPGIWLAPYVISEPTEVFQKHPDWFLRHPDGRLKRVGPWPSEDSDWARNENPKRYGLDITVPGAAAWLADLFDTVANRWGYDLIKLDFVDWSLLSAHRYHDPTVSRAAAYRKGFEIMRRAIGPDRHLLDCGPGPVTVGLLDSMRIELDQPPVTWKQYFLGSASSAPAAAKRYYFHKRTWINDADHVCLNLLPPAQAQAAATLIALTGGNLLSGDRLGDLDPTRIEILKKVFPSSGESARPVDLFDTDQHTAFALEVRRTFGKWTVVGVFNVSETESVERALPLDRLWLDPSKTYVAYDFWKERLHGDVTGKLTVGLPPASVALLALHEKQGRPQVIGTDRHVLQGALELEDVSWNTSTRTLEGISLGPSGTAHNLAVYLPEPHRWVQGGPFLFHDFPGYTLKMMGDHILRVRVRFDEGPRVKWQVRFDEFFARR
jgi:alpha-galactosidase